MKRNLPEKTFLWTEKLAYAIGLIVTDGNLSSDKRHITLRSSDKQLLHTYKKCLGIEHIKIGTSYSNGFTKNPSYRVAHGDVLFYKWCNSIGIFENKTHTIGPLTIPDEMFVDFLRGHLDGDGSITTYMDTWNSFKKPSYVYKRLWVRFISASEQHLIWLQKRILEIFGVHGHLNRSVPKNPKHVPMYSLKFGKKDSLILLRRMYHHKNVPCLKRKRVIANQFI